MGEKERGPGEEERVRPLHGLPPGEPVTSTVATGGVDDSGPPGEATARAANLNPSKSNIERAAPGRDAEGAAERSNLNLSKSNVDRSVEDDGGSTEAAINTSHSNIKNL